MAETRSDYGTEDLLSVLGRDSCWAGIHYHEMHHRKGFDGKMQHFWVQVPALKGKAEHACDGECDCVHRSEENWAAIEQKQKSENRKMRRKLEKELLAESPLAAVNPNFQVKL